MQAMVTRVLRALVRRAAEGDVEALEALAELDNLMPDLLGAGVFGYREQGHSWADVAKVLGVSRQSAHERFSKAVPL